LGIWTATDERRLAMRSATYLVKIADLNWSIVRPYPAAA
jgi:hypothetical protein